MSSTIEMQIGAKNVKCEQGFTCVVLEVVYDKVIDEVSIQYPERNYIEYLKYSNILRLSTNGIYVLDPKTQRFN